MDQGFDDGCYTFLLPTNEPNPENKSYTHPDFDPIWAVLLSAASPQASMLPLMVITTPYRPALKTTAKVNSPWAEMPRRVNCPY